MRVHPMIALIVTGALCATAVACARDNPVGPPPNPPSATPAAQSLLGGSATIIPLHRTSPLLNPIQTTRTVGVLGGTLSLPDAGLTIVVPPLAVMSPTTITVTALAGSNVAYELAPHGITFLTPLIATQDLRNTEAAAGGSINPLSLYVGYFPDVTHITTVTELLNLNVNLLSQTSTALIWHFSGYVWSSGREDTPMDGGTQ